MDRKQRSVPRLAATGAVIAGLAAGSYGIANAARRWRHDDHDHAGADSADAA